MVVIRLSRAGAKKRPFYHIVVAEKRSSRDGRFIENIGYFNPIATGKDIPLSLDMAKCQEWIAKGAQPSDRVQRLINSMQKANQEATQAA